MQLGTNIKASYEITQIECTIGNSKYAQIILKDNGIYTEHATITRVKKNIYITPFSKDTEVYLNADPIDSPHILRENDIINIGPYSLIIQNEEEGFFSKTQFISLKNLLSAKVLISIVAIIVVFSGIVLFSDKILQFYPVDSVKAIQEAEKKFSNNDFEGAKKILEKIKITDNSNKEAKDFLQNVNRRIRIKNAFEDAQKVLNSQSLAGYEESVIELSDVLNELAVVGLDPSNQIEIREVLNDLEKRKIEKY